MDWTAESPRRSNPSSGLPLLGSLACMARLLACTVTFICVSFKKQSAAAQSVGTGVLRFSKQAEQRVRFFCILSPLYTFYTTSLSSWLRRHHVATGSVKCLLPHTRWTGRPALALESSSRESVHQYESLATLAPGAWYAIAHGILHLHKLTLLDEQARLSWTGQSLVFTHATHRCCRHPLTGQGVSFPQLTITKCDT